MRPNRNAKIVATLGPASSSRDTIEALFHAIEQQWQRQISVLLDLQGPKLRIGTFANGPVRLEAGSTFRLDLDVVQGGDGTRVAMPPMPSAMPCGTSPACSMRLPRWRTRRPPIPPCAWPGSAPGRRFWA